MRPELTVIDASSPEGDPRIRMIRVQPSRSTPEKAQSTWGDSHSTADHLRAVPPSRSRRATSHKHPHGAHPGSGKTGEPTLQGTPRPEVGRGARVPKQWVDEGLPTS